MALWRGPLLGDLRDQPWVGAEATAAEEMLRHCLDYRISALLTLGRVPPALAAAAQLSAADPLSNRGCLLHVLQQAPELASWPRDPEWTGAVEVATPTVSRTTGGTAVEIDLLPISEFYGGAIYFGGDQAAVVLHEWHRWTAICRTASIRRSASSSCLRGPASRSRWPAG